MAEILIPALGDRVALGYDPTYVDPENVHVEGLVVDVTPDGFDFEPHDSLIPGWSVMNAEQAEGLVKVALVLTGTELVTEHQAAQDGT